MKILDLPLASILWQLNQYETGIHGILKSPFCIKFNLSYMYMYKGFMRYGWNKNNHKALCVPFIRQYSVVKGLRNYSLELRTTHYAHTCIYLFIDSFIFFGLRWWIYMFVKWAALPLPKFIKWAYIPLPHVGKYGVTKPEIFCGLSTNLVDFHSSS